VQLQAKELALEQAKIENKAANDAAKLELSAKQGEVRAMVEVARIAATQTNTERSALLEAARSAEELRLEGQRIAALARDKGNEGA